MHKPSNLYYKTKMSAMVNYKTNNKYLNSNAIQVKLLRFHCLCVKLAMITS